MRQTRTISSHRTVRRNAYGLLGQKIDLRYPRAGMGRRGILADFRGNGIIRRGRVHDRRRTCGTEDPGILHEPYIER